MDTRTAVWVLLGLAALLTAGILAFLARAIKVLVRLEETTQKLEENAVPLLLSIRRITDEVEPIVRKTSEHYQMLDQGFTTLSRSPIFSLFSPVLGMGRNPFRTLGGLIRVARGAIAGVSKAREVLRHSQAEKNTAILAKSNLITTKETTHGQ
jgi:hypothetical protein